MQTDGHSECPEGYRFECLDGLDGVCTADCATCPTVGLCSALCVSFDVCPGPAERAAERKEAACRCCAAEGVLRSGKTNSCEGCEFFERKHGN